MSTTLAAAVDRDSRTPEGGLRRVLVDLAAVGAIAVCALILHRDGLFGGPAYYELDTRLFYYPLAHWVGQQLHAGVVPLWLPGIFTGYPIFADGELGLAYLPQILLLYLLPAPLAMVWLRVLHVFLAGLFTYGYLKTLRLDPLPALGGALVFAFGSFLSAQMHHENVVRSAVWLPAVFACAERAVQQRGIFRVPRFGMWSALGALAFSQSALGLHVQPVLMLALALGSYMVFRALIPVNLSPLSSGGEGGRGGEVRSMPRDALAQRNAYWPIAAGAAIVAGGLAMAAIQWLPLGEWALVSSRRGGVDYVFASAFGLAPENLPTLIFPYFFRLPDATTWWSLWQQWETELYVGIPTLALAIVGIVFSRRVELVYFLVLGALSLLIGMASYVPFVNLHQLLWSIPGFSFLRAPGRFTYLVVFAFACLAAFGLQALGQRRLRLVLAVVGGVPTVALLAALLALLPTWRAFLMNDPARARALVEATYLATRAQYPIDPALVINGLLSSLDFANLKTAWSLVLLGLTTLAFVAWLELGVRRAAIGQGLFVGLLAVDLLVFAADFHPRAPLDSLAPGLAAPPVASGGRVLLHDPSDLPALEPNQLLSDGIATVQGYSSLPSQRYVELEAATSSQPALFDLWGAPLFVVEPSHPSDLHEIDGVRFRAQHPLASGFGGATTTSFTVPSTVGPIASLRLIGTLSYAFRAPQRQTVAMLSTDSGAQFPIRAGVELSERAYDRPSLGGLVQHQKAHVAFDFEDVTPEGEDYPGHLYEADIPVAGVVRTITITPTDPEVLVEIHGLAPIDASGTAHPLRLADRVGLSQSTPDGPLLDTQALPRAYLLPRAQAFSPARHAGLTATQLVASSEVDLHTMLLVEGDPNTPPEPSGAQPALAASQVEDLGPNAVRITASADASSYVVLEDFYHRGWTARVDGQPARVLIANALFRAVAIDPGTHTIDFRFEPLSHVLGAAVSAVSLMLNLLIIGWGLRSR